MGAGGGWLRAVVLGLGLAVAPALGAGVARAQGEPPACAPVASAPQPGCAPKGPGVVGIAASSLRAGQTGVVWTIRLRALYCGGYDVGRGVLVELPSGFPHPAQPTATFAGGPATVRVVAAGLLVAARPGRIWDQICLRTPIPLGVEVRGLTNPRVPGTYPVRVSVGAASAVIPLRIAGGVGPLPVPGALTAVRQFYEDLGARRFPAAYALLGPSFQRQQPYAPWRAGYRDTARVEVAAVAPAPGSAWVGVFVRAWTTAGQRQGYLGAWQVGPVGGRLRLLQAAIWPLDGGHRTHCLLGRCPALTVALPPAAARGAYVPLRLGGLAPRDLPVDVSFVPYTGRDWLLRHAAAGAASQMLQVPAWNGWCAGCADHPQPIRPGLHGFLVFGPGRAWTLQVSLAVLP